MKSDLGIKQDANDELSWGPAVDTTAIGVEVDNDVVTLTGCVRNYMEKPIAKRATERVVSVHGVMQKIEVRLPGAHTNTDVAQTARAAFE